MNGVGDGGNGLVTAPEQPGQVVVAEWRLHGSTGSGFPASSPRMEDGVLPCLKFGVISNTGVNLGFG